MALIDKLTAIADAIRGKTGGTEKLTMDQMAEEVDGLSVGGPLQAKTVCPNHSEQVIAPDEGYYGLKKVTVEAVPRLPFAAVSVFAGLPESNVVETVVNVSAAVSVFAGLPETDTMESVVNITTGSSVTAEDVTE